MLLAFPLVILLATAILQMLCHSPFLRRALSISGTSLFLLTAIFLLLKVEHEGLQLERIGNWPGSCGIVLVADSLSALMLLVTGVLGVAVSIYSWKAIDPPREAHGYHPLLSLLLLGVSGAFLTGDLFNLYVWFELMLMASFVLMALGGERAQLEGGIKYVTLSLMSSMFLLSSVGLLYHLTGSLNMAELSLSVKQTSRPELVSAISMVLLVAFGIKAAIFPLFFWLPASYHTPPAPVSAIFAGLLTKVGVYALLRVFTVIFRPEYSAAYAFIAFLAALTMLSGVLGAMVQKDLRRLLSFHIISQIGYMILGLALFTPLALTGSIFYIVHHIIVKTNLFLIAGFVYRLAGSYSLSRLGGLYSQRPFLAVLFLIPALSLAGLPPFSGFWAKLLLIRASFESEYYLLGATALFVSLLTLFSMTKIWNEAFLRPPMETGSSHPAPPSGMEEACYLVPVILLAACTVALSAAPAPWVLLAERASQDLLEPVSYINRVLEGTRACSS